MRLADPRFQRVICLCFACAFLIGTANPADKPQPLQLLYYAPLEVDGGTTTASTTLRLLNPNPAPLKYNLTIQNAKAKNTGQTVGWVAMFYGTDNKPVGPVLQGTLGGRGTLLVRVDLSNVIEAGETTADLMNEKVKIGEIKLTKDRGLPLKVSLEGNPPEKPEVEFVEGEPLDLHWKNEDPMTYPLAWEFSIKGVTKTGESTVGPNGTERFSVAPQDAWFSWWQSLFKSETVDGTVRVSYKRDGSPSGYPSKMFPIKAKLSSCKPSTRDIWAVVLLLVILAVGGAFSTYVKVDLVNRIRTISIKRRLGQLDRVIGESGPQLSSQLRVSLWLERYRIKATLPRRILFTPETAATLAQSDSDTDALKQRVDLAAQIADASVRLDHIIDAGGFPPTLAERIIKDLQSAQDLLKKSVLSVGELERVRSLLGGAVNILDHAGQPDEDLERIIAARMQNINATFTPAFLQNQTCVTIRNAVPIPFTYLTPAVAQAASQADRDANTRKLLVIAAMVTMGSTDHDILQSLEPQDSVSLQMAEQLLAELKEGVSLATLTGEITANPPRLYITIDRDTVRVGMPIMLKLKFNDPAYNRAAARRRIESKWSFGHQNVNLTEKGWEIYHYFPNVEQYTVGVTFKTINQVDIHAGAPITYDVPVSPQKMDGYAHGAVEAQRWFAGLLVAVVGLFAGAKEKILTLDTVGIIIAVFLLGFTIDVAKNLLVSQAEGKT